MDYFLSAREIADKSGDRWAEARTYTNLGKTTTMLKKHAAATDYFCAGLRLGLEIKSLASVMELLSDMIPLLIHITDYKRAVLIIKIVKNAPNATQKILSEADEYLTTIARNMKTRKDSLIDESEPALDAFELAQEMVSIYGQK